MGMRCTTIAKKQKTSAEDRRGSSQGGNLADTLHADWLMVGLSLSFVRRKMGMVARGMGRGQRSWRQRRGLEFTNQCRNTWEKGTAIWPSNTPKLEIRSNRYSRSAVKGKEGTVVWGIARLAKRFR